MDLRSAWCWKADLHMTTTLRLAADPGTRARFGGALRVLGVFIAVCAVALVVSAAAQWWRRSDILGQWPLAPATIQSCSLRRDYPFQRNGGGIVFWIRCDLQYSVAGETHSTHLTSSTRHTGRSGTMFTLRGGSFVAERPEREFEAWIRRHPPGSPLAIRYDPAHVESATLVGVDSVVDVDPVSGSLLGAAVFAVLALSSWLGSRRLLPRNP
jgi:hypothetical protein